MGKHRGKPKKRSGRKRLWIGVAVIIMLIIAVGTFAYLNRPSGVLGQWILTPTIGSQKGQVHLFMAPYVAEASVIGDPDLTLVRVSRPVKISGGPIPLVSTFSRFSSDTLVLNAWGVSWASKRELNLMQELPIYAITVYVEVGPRMFDTGMTSDGLVVVWVNGVEMNRTLVKAHQPVAVGTNSDTIRVYDPLLHNMESIMVKNITVAVFPPGTSGVVSSEVPDLTNNRALDAMSIGISQRGGYGDFLGATSTVSYPMVYDTGIRQFEEVKTTQATGPAFRTNPDGTTTALAWGPGTAITTTEITGQKVWRTVTEKEFEGRALFGEEAYVITSPFSPKYVASGVFLNVTDILGPGLTIDQLLAYVEQTKAGEPQTLHPTIEQVFDLTGEVITICPVHSIYFPGFDGVTLTARKVGVNGGGWAGALLFDQGTVISYDPTLLSELAIGNKEVDPTGSPGRKGVLLGACAVSGPRPSQISPASILFLKLPGTTMLREIWSMFPAPAQPGVATVAPPATPSVTVSATMIPPPQVTTTPPPQVTTTPPPRGTVVPTQPPVQPPEKSFWDKTRDFFRDIWRKITERGPESCPKDRPIWIDGKCILRGV